MTQSSTLYVHNPVVNRVYRQESGILVISMGNPNGHADVIIMFNDDATYDDLNDAVIQFLNSEYDTKKNRISERLEYLRGEIRDEKISYAEISELQSLADHIAPDDFQLREWAGLSEHE